MSMRCYKSSSGGECMATCSDMIDLDMSSNRWKYFRWTPRTAWISFVYMVAVPSVVGYVGYVTDVRLPLLQLVPCQGAGKWRCWKLEAALGFIVLIYRFI